MSQNTTQPSRVALVTGGGRGIGRAICVALAQNGYSVAINYANSTEEALHTAQFCEQAARHAKHQDACFITVQGNVATEQDCEALYQQTKDALTEPDVLINNAGITRDNLLMRMSLEDFDEVLAVNLRAAFVLSKLSARTMAKKRFGRIINLSSVVGISGNAGQANYAASKAGLIGLTKALSKELGSRCITVNAVAPGFIATSMTDALPENARERLLASLSIPRPGAPEDVAALVAFLSSDAAAYITGQVIAVDGGLAL